MAHLGWLIALLPFACDCANCDSALFCVVVATVIAGVVVAALLIARELWALRMFKGM